MLIKKDHIGRRHVILSVIMHMAVIFVLILPIIMPELSFFQSPEESDEKYIRVVDVPDLDYEHENPKDPKYHSDKARKVEKEELTEELITKEGQSASSKNETGEDKKEKTKEAEGLENKKPSDGKTETAKLFPSDDRLGDILNKPTIQSPEKKSGTTLSLNTSDLKYYKYLSDMKRRIEFFWDYPDSSVRRGEQGEINISFTITKDGEVKDIQVEKSSYYPALDDAALSAIRLANPFVKFPIDFDIEELNVKGRFRYTLVGKPVNGNAGK